MIDSFKGKNSWLSNFHKCEIFYDGTTWPSVEHAYVAQKAIPEEYGETRAAILEIINPSTVKRLGRKITIRKDWDDVKLIIMTNLVRCKFTQNEDLKEKLLATGDDELIEGNWWGDTFWGVCEGVGENHLGKILMQVRKELRS